MCNQILRLIAIMSRAVSGSAISFPWKEGLLAGALIVAAVFMGKAFGGFVADKFGLTITMTVSSVTAALILVMFNEWMVPSLVGQYAVNMSMPITLFLLYRLFPKSPGFAFGLAASALWPGVLIGQLIHLTGVWSDLLVVICLLTGLIAVYLTERRVRS